MSDLELISFIFSIPFFSKKSTLKIPFAIQIAKKKIRKELNHGNFKHLDKVFHHDQGQ